MTERSINSTTEYFFEEGKVNLRNCVGIAFQSAILRGIDTIVMFTGVGEGPSIAIEEFLGRPEYQGIKLIAVTFPYGQQFGSGNAFKAVDIPDETRKTLEDHHIPLVRAHLPFNPITAHYRHHGILGQDLTLIGNALSIFGGSMSLCVQAAIMACDAGLLQLGDHVVSMTSDTAVIVRTAPTERLLTDFIVREVLCKPLYLTIGKSEESPIPLLESSTDPLCEDDAPTTPEIQPHENPPE
ncbi:MAG: hypothetical protein ACLGPM_06620 [Acidobacteriota bacterium]